MRCASIIYAFLNKFTVTNEKNEEMKRRVADVLRFSKNGNLLEIGCSAGYFLKVCQERGISASGIEINPDTATYARDTVGLDIKIGTLENFDFPPETFDVVVMYDVLEHLHEPILCLNKINKILKQNGLLVIQVPNIASIESIIFGSRWYHDDVPRHLYHFSVSTLSNILLKNGFQIKQIKYSTDTTGLAMSLLRLIRDNMHIFLYEKKISKSVDILDSKVTKVKDLILICLKFILTPLAILFAYVGKSGVIVVFCIKE